MLIRAVNPACNTAINKAFTVARMTRPAPQAPIDRALAWAAARGWNQSQLADKLGVKPQHVTNWKTRGMPPEWHAPVARLFGRSVDELLGLAPAASVPASPAYSIAERGGPVYIAPKRIGLEAAAQAVLDAFAKLPAAARPAVAADLLKMLLAQPLPDARTVADLLSGGAFTGKHRRA